MLCVCVYGCVCVCVSEEGAGEGEGRRGQDAAGRRLYSAFVVKTFLIK